MKTHSLPVFAAGALALALSASLASAQNMAADPRDPVPVQDFGRPPTQTGVPTVVRVQHFDEFTAMDSTGDGKVSQFEHQAFARGMVAKTDANRDGGVTATEWNSAAPTVGVEKMSSSATAAQVQAMDTDQDGKISVAESEAYSADIFAKADKDSDGQLTKDEYDAARR
jgi:Ca2+-binding EF-hand superfamily protein